MSYARWHWRIFNIFARLFGILALLIGLVSVVVNILSVTQSDADLSDAWLAAASGGFLLIVGSLFMAVRPYRPDLKGAFIDGQRQNRIRWWTGDVRYNRDEHAPNELGEQ